MSLTSFLFSQTNYGLLIDNSLFVGITHQLCIGAQIEFFQKTASIRTDRLDTKRQLTRDLFHGQAGCIQIKHLVFTIRQPGWSVNSLQVKQHRFGKFSANESASLRDLPHRVNDCLRGFGLAQISVGSCRQHLNRMLIFSVSGQDQSEWWSSLRSRLLQRLKKSQGVEFTVEDEQITFHTPVLHYIAAGISFAHDRQIACITYDALETLAKDRLGIHQINTHVDHPHLICLAPADGFALRQDTSKNVGAFTFPATTVR